MTLFNEQTFFFSEPPKDLSGPFPRLHLSTKIRWALHGVLVNGQRVKLEAFRLGGRWVTSREAVERFCARLTALSLQDHSQPAVPTQSQAAQQAADELTGLGL